jgi:hypothetical protein
MAVGRQEVTWTIAIIGTAAVAAGLWRRQWLDALLAAVAAAALALLCGAWLPAARPGAELTIDPSSPPASLDGAATVRVSGDGLRAAQWTDLPARPLAWEPPAADTFELDFPRQLTLGRMFTLTVRRSADAPARLQLLAENGQLLSEARGTRSLTVQWLPPVAERMVLRARLLDDSGKAIAEGPVPVSVRESEPLRVQGRFGAPSFDLRALDELFTGSGTLLDWQVMLGKTVTRSETARAAIDRPDLLVVDAAWFEHSTGAVRDALLSRVGQGTPLLVLGANAADAALWSRTLELRLKPQPDQRMIGAPLAMASAPLNPGSAEAGAWSAAGDGTLWTRQWRGGRIGWLGVGSWHRYAITDPQALALWWQSVLDRLGVERAQDVVWLDPEEMPLPGQRLEACARGVRGDVTFGELRQKLAWQRRPDRVDASCAAVWPSRAGWLTLQSQGSQRARGDVYVFAASDWPQWQAAQRRHATALYAARTPTPAAGVREPIQRWPFALVFMLAMLALWWRERR